MGDFPTWIGHTLLVSDSSCWVTS